MTDLFKTPELLPEHVQNILTEFGECGSYDRCEELLKVLQPLGYTFEFYLDAEPFNLVEIPKTNTAITEREQKLIDALELTVKTLLRFYNPNESVELSNAIATLKEFQQN